MTVTNKNEGKAVDSKKMVTNNNENGITINNNSNYKKKWYEKK